MSLFEIFEKLINERGSAAILREHVALLRAQHTALEGAKRDAELKASQLEADNKQLCQRLAALEAQAQDIGKQQTSDKKCDHCGSPSIKHIGNVGAKQLIFECLHCKKQSYISPKNPFPKHL
jgi:hypothetical protein